MGKREMSSMSERQSSEEAVGDCVSALLSLSSPKCEDDYREHLSPTAPVNQRPAKVARTTSSTHTKGVAQPSLDPGAKVWINQWVELVRGKYEGRRAFIVGMTTKKFRVRVVGVEHQLEFYPSMFRKVENLTPPQQEAVPRVQLDSCASSAHQPSTSVIEQELSQQRSSELSQATSSVGEPELPTLALVKQTNTNECSTRYVLEATTKDTLTSQADICAPQPDRTCSLIKVV